MHKCLYSKFLLFHRTSSNTRNARILGQVHRKTLHCSFHSDILTMKKNLSQEMEKQYHPRSVEQGWYDWWQQMGYFKPSNTDHQKKTFSIVLPPPNITGYLHIGHALTVALEDTLCRYKKMKGYNVLWIPGVDHAGISTQVVVEKKIKREINKTRHELGREEFLEQVWRWKYEYGDRIENQIKQAGAMTDWNYKVFTMDEMRSEAVMEAFVRLYEDGLIYRENKLVNWCVALNTAISDMEVEHVHLSKRTEIPVPSLNGEKYEFGVMHKFRYEIEGPIKLFIEVGTTRIETMLGDTAIAIHPDDERYKSLHGKYAIHPFFNRRIPIICDSELVNPEFGTGAVKITPAHSFDDYHCGKRHNLEFLNIFNRDGTLNEAVVGSEFAKFNRFNVRNYIIEKLKEKELYIGSEDHEMDLPTCSRSGDILEPLMVPQWFVKCNTLASEALQLVQSEKVRLLPSQHISTWRRWLENIHDWCISRQLWWGHRIPAYKLVNIDNHKKHSNHTGTSINQDEELEENWIVARNVAEAHEKVKQLYPNLKNYELHQDEDVLDTWFSSGLYPLSALGWPSEKRSSELGLEKFYPLTVMETGSDILFFWVARMTMLCTYLHPDRVPPFKDVYLHAMVRDAQGRKMSKSLGNVIDPIDVVNGVTLEELKKQVMRNTNIDKSEVQKALKGMEKDFPKGIPECGTDALRFTLAQYTQQGRQINLDVQRAVSNRHFCNKIWQATRFAVIQFESNNWDPATNNHDYSIGSLYENLVHNQTSQKGHQYFINRWILSKLSSTVIRINQDFESYMFSDAANAMFHFFLYHFCDVYLEVVKPILYANAQNQEHDISLKSAKGVTLTSLHFVLTNTLKLMHPIMPFITEELWNRIPKNTINLCHESIMTTEYPDEEKLKQFHCPESEEIMDHILSIVHHIRSLSKQLQSSDNSLNDVKGESCSNCPLIVLQHESNDATTKLKMQVMQYQEYIKILTKYNQIQVLSREDFDKKKEMKLATSVVNPQCAVYIPVDSDSIQKNIQKLEKQLEALLRAREKLWKQKQSPQYLEKVPESVKKRNEEKEQEYESQITKIESDIKRLRSI